MTIRWKVLKNRRSVKVHDTQLSRVYTKDKEVIADPKTIGLLVFDTKENAMNWKRESPICSKYDVIKVEAHGEGIRPKVLFGYPAARKYEIYGLSFLENYDYVDNINSEGYVHIWEVPKGTLAYKSVTPLE